MNIKNKRAHDLKKFILIKNKEEFDFVINYFQSKKWLTYGNLNELPYNELYPCISYGDGYFYNTLESMTTADYEMISFSAFILLTNLF